MSIGRVTTTWTGFTGAPGYSNFFFNAATDEVLAASAVTAVNRFWSQISFYLPDAVTVSTSPEVTIIDEATGAIEGYVDADEDGASYTGQGDGPYAAPAGAVINWETAEVRNSRRVRGRTFLVPLDGSVYQSDGTILSTPLDRLRNDAATLVDEGQGAGFCVWSRPVGGSGGVAATVTSSRVPDMSAVLRSRRD